MPYGQQKNLFDPAVAVWFYSGLNTSAGLPYAVFNWPPNAAKPG
jgi:hypothetical protein|tara:strand:- start:332 stop:463 length:132 start_codon:yes stop_codon:yes gene_type:complete